MGRAELVANPFQNVSTGFIGLMVEAFGMLWAAFKGRQKFVCEDAVTVPSAREEFYMKKMAVISVKQALVSTEQVQKLMLLKILNCKTLDHGRRKFGVQP